MALRHNPVFYLFLFNGLLWGLPLAMIQIQTLLADRNGWQLERVLVQPSPTGDASVSIALIPPHASRSRADHLVQPEPVVSTTAATSLPFDDTSISQPTGLSISRAVDAEEIPMTPPDLLTQLQGADGLGGPITLDSSKAPLMPIAARVEQLQWQRSNDSLAALPLHWRHSVRQELGQGVRVSQAATVRLPVRELAERQEVPVIINDQGIAEGLVEPRHARIREAVENWAARQQAAEPGTVQVLLVAAEPLLTIEE